MAKPKTVVIGVLNVTIHPHTPERYLRLFRSAKNNRQAVNYHGSKYAMLGEFKHFSDDFYRGALHAYTHIDFEKPWLDTERQQALSDDEKKAIRIPENAKPEYEEVFFMYYAKKHLIFLDTTNLTIGSARKVFQRQFELDEVRDELEQVDVTEVQQVESLDRIFAIPDPQHLTIVLKRPNPDDLGDEEAVVMRRLAEQHAGRETRVLDAQDKGQGIKPNEETMRDARVALKNGYVKGLGYGAGKTKMEEMTEHHPLLEKFEYIEDEQTMPQFLLSKVDYLLQRMKG